MELQIRNISKTYSNGVQALKDVTLTIRPGMYDLRRRIWRRVISKAELPQLEQYAVISTKLLAGRTVVHVYSDTVPGPGFEPSDPDLEDVYFNTMAGHIGRRRERPEVAP
jgi:ABC-2 type transport system ATP-binding protein